MADEHWKELQDSTQARRTGQSKTRSAADVRKVQSDDLDRQYNKVDSLDKAGDQAGYDRERAKAARMGGEYLHNMAVDDAAATRARVPKDSAEMERDAANVRAGGRDRSGEVHGFPKKDVTIKTGGSSTAKKVP